MSTEVQGYRAESPENKVSILKTEANEVFALAVFSKFLEINMFIVVTLALCAYFFLSQLTLLRWSGQVKWLKRNYNAAIYLSGF